jgi:hypothetical protein
MLNVHAAVLESVFPTRKTGFFRSVLEHQAVSYSTGISQLFDGSVVPGAPVETSGQFPADTIQAGVHIAWGNMWSGNDLGLKVFNASGSLFGESNYLNAAGLTGRREKVTINNPSTAGWRSQIYHTGNIGSSQRFFGAVEITRAQFGTINDLQNLSPADQEIVKQSLRSFVMLPEGKSFNPGDVVLRTEFAAALMRGARVPQYVAALPLYTDVRDLTTRELVESVQSYPNGKLFVDATNGGAFFPHAQTARWIAAVALVKAAGLESLAASTPLLVSDYAQIPAAYRGYAWARKRTRTDQLTCAAVSTRPSESRSVNVAGSAVGTR